MLQRRMAMGLLGVALALTLSSCDNPFDTPTESGSPTSTDEPPVLSEPVALCVPNGNADGFVTVDTVATGTPGEIGTTLISMLVDAGALPAGVEMINLVVGDQLQLDMNAAFGQALNQTGSAGEYMIMGSVINTLLAFFDVEFMSITVEGEALITGHAIYDQPLTFYNDQRTVWDGPLELGDLPGTVAGLPDPQAIENLFRYLKGYWISDNGQFVDFRTRCAKPVISFGLWDSEYGRAGVMTGVEATGEFTVNATFLLRGRPASMETDAYPEESTVVKVDLTRFPLDPSITLVIAQLGDGQEFTYVRGGDTLDEAYDEAHQ